MVEAQNDSEDFQALEAAFLDACRLAPGDRDRFLAERFASRLDLVERARRLLRHDRTSDTILREVGREAARLVAAETPAPCAEGFKILDVIGRGGMSIVYAAEQQQPHRVIALKVLAPQRQHPEQLVQLLREADVLARLDHPCIARVYAVGRTEDHRPYFAMERIEGCRLDEWVRHARPTTTRRLAMLIRICAAIEHAHRRGVVHRDLKPSNVLVGLDEEPKVVDFGIAQLTGPVGDLRADSGSGSGSDRSGTLPYMSPEQLAGDAAAIDTRTDVYGLGALAYELLSGSPPYDLAGLSSTEALRRIQAGPPVPLGARSRVHRGDLEAIVGKAMHRDAEQRYGSASQLAEDLQRHLAREPVRARKATSGYLLRRFVARHRIAVVAGILVLGSLVSGLYVSVHALERAWSSEAAARNEVATTREIGDRLASMLVAADDAQLAADVRFRDVLLLARDRLERDIPRQPVVAVELGAALGRALLCVGEFEVAHAQMSQSLAAAAALDPATGREMQFGLVRALLGLGRVAEAHEGFRAMAVHGETVCALDKHTILAGACVIEALARGGDIKAAEDETQRLEHCLAHLADQNLAPLLRAAVGFRRSDLAARAGRLAEAMQLRDAAMLQSPSVGGVVLTQRERALLAGEVLYRRIEPSAIPDGVASRRAIMERNRIGRELIGDQRFVDAEAHARETLRLAELEGLGEEQSGAVAVSQVGQALSGQQRHAEAIEQMERYVDIALRSFGPAGPYTLVAKQELARVLMSAGEFQRVADFATEALATLDGGSHARPGLRRNFQTMRGRALLRLDRLDEAETVLKEVRQVLLTAGEDVGVLDADLRALEAKRAKLRER